MTGEVSHNFNMASIDTLHPTWFPMPSLSSDTIPAMLTPLTTPCPATLIFAIGGVLMDWNPRNLYRAVSPNDELEISFDEWKHLQDACGLL
ncbi:MAG: hypothetical protein A2Z71_01045 [Chloroflexi bacterium RBG_13_50_21]|nr:MAG: hypothetical protein A2Z71_01045 [Chloroflexi bacterium RBG_13_50_21]